MADPVFRGEAGGYHMGNGRGKQGGHCLVGGTNGLSDGGPEDS